MAAATASSYSSGTTIASLNADMLSAILSLLPVYPRIMIASVVCKRWRQIALRSVKKLPECFLTPMRVSVEALQLFSSLTSLNLASLAHIPSSITIPRSVVALQSPDTYCDVDVTPLDHIRTLLLSHIGSQELNLRLLEATRSSLTSLVYGVSNYYRVLSNYNFPLLTSLKTGDVNFIAAIASQLVTLRLPRYFELEALLDVAPSISFPQLRHFEAESSVFESSAFASVCSRLSSLSLGVKKPCPLSLLTALRALRYHVTYGENMKAESAFLHQITDDTRLCTMVTELIYDAGEGTEPMPGFLLNFPKLTHVVIGVSLPLPKVALPVPIIRAVTHLCVSGSYELPTESILSLVIACPMLQEFHFRIAFPLMIGQEDKLHKMIGRLIERRLDRIDISLAHHHKAIEEAKAFAKLLRRKDPTHWTLISVALKQKRIPLTR